MAAASSINSPGASFSDNKRVVEVCDPVDSNVVMLLRMYECRLGGYADVGYKTMGGLPGQPPARPMGLVSWGLKAILVT